MEVGSSNPTAKERLFVAAAPVLLISMGYIDPGKWVSCIDSGARFGNDLVPFVLFFNLFGILCYCLSAYVGLITGKNLAQVLSFFGSLMSFSFALRLILALADNLVL